VERRNGRASRARRNNEARRTRAEDIHRWLCSIPHIKGRCRAIDNKPDRTRVMPGPQTWLLQTGQLEHENIAAALNHQIGANMVEQLAEWFSCVYHEYSAGLDINAG